jgi:SAM-dependent methyltransferase
MARYFFDDLKTYSLAGTEQEVHFITSILNLTPHSSILDLYCGYGRHAIELAKLGYDVTGVDATKAFLDIARQKAGEEGAKLKFIQCDMRALHFKNEFSAVINMFAAFGFFSDEENAGVLMRVAQALKPKGLFLIDLLNRDWMVRNNLNRYWRHPNGEYVLTFKIELNQGIVMMKRRLFNQVTGEKSESEFVLRAYSYDEMKSILGQSGFVIKSIYGGFDKRKYGMDSPRMIILAQKQTAHPEN